MNEINDKSKALIEIHLNDISDSEGSRSIRINPILHIIYDKRGNTALLVIGGYNLTKYNTIQIRKDIKVFNIKRREINIEPAFTIVMNYARMNPIVMFIKQKHCEYQEIAIDMDKKYIVLIGGISFNGMNY